VVDQNIAVHQKKINTILKLNQVLFKAGRLTVFVLFLFSTAYLSAQADTLTHKETLPSRIMKLFEIKWRYNSTLLTPVFSYDPTSKVSFGANSYTLIKPKDTTLSFFRPSALGMYFKYSTANWIYVQAQLDQFTNNNWRLIGDMKLNRAYERYYGIEMQQRPEEGLQFSSFQTYFEGTALKGMTDMVYMGMKLDVGYKKVKSLDEFELPLQGGTYAGIGPVFGVETRDNLLFPEKGSYLMVSSVFYTANCEKSGGYISAKVDYRKYFVLWKGIISATQFVTDLNTTNIPYIKMPKVFGQNRLRGISNNNKYIGQNMFYVQTELRKFVYGPFALVAFSGVGNVWSNWNDLPERRLKYSYGGGLRLRVSKENKLNGRFDVGFGPEGDMGIFVLIKEAF